MEERCMDSSPEYPDPGIYLCGVQHEKVPVFLAPYPRLRKVDMATRRTGNQQTWPRAKCLQSTKVVASLRSHKVLEEPVLQPASVCNTIIAGLSRSYPKPRADQVRLAQTS